MPCTLLSCMASESSTELRECVLPGARSDPKLLKQYVECELSNLKHLLSRSEANTRKACQAVQQHSDRLARELVHDSSLLVASVKSAATNAVSAKDVADALEARGAVCRCTATGASARRRATKPLDA